MQYEVIYGRRRPAMDSSQPLVQDDERKNISRSPIKRYYKNESQFTIGQSEPLPNPVRHSPIQKRKETTQQKVQDSPGKNRK